MSTPGAANETALPSSALIIYGLPYLSYAVAFQPLALYVPAFYSDDLALPLAGVGLAIAASRLLDVVTDPLIGTLGDRTQTRWGRRRPWIALGALPLLLAMWMVFAPVAPVSLPYLFGWTTVLFLAFTIIDLPYKAWGAELSTDYHERSRIAAWREALGFGGQLLAIVVLLGVQWLGYSEPAQQLKAIALSMLITLPPFLALALWRVPERPPDRLHVEQTAGWAGLKLLVGNTAFQRIIVSVVLFCSGLTIQATLHRIVLDHVAGQPELFLPMLLCENTLTIAVVPLWKRIAYRIGKHRALSLAALWVGAWSLFLPLFGKGDGLWLVTLLVVRGMSFAPILFLANAIAADVVDADTLASGRQRTGLFFAVWAMISKLAIAIGVVLGTGIPALFGIEPSVPSSFTAAAEFALMGVYGWLPGLLMAAGAMALWHFPITHEAQRQLRAKIAAGGEQP